MCSSDLLLAISLAVLSINCINPIAFLLDLAFALKLLSAFITAYIKFSSTLYFFEYFSTYSEYSFLYIIFCIFVGIFIMAIILIKSIINKIITVFFFIITILNYSFLSQRDVSFGTKMSQKKRSCS